MSQYCFHGAPSLPNIHTNETDRRAGRMGPTNRQNGRTDGMDRTLIPGLFGLTFKPFNQFSLKIYGFAILEAKYHMEIAPERVRNAPRILGNGFGVIFQCRSAFLDIFSI